MTRSSLRRPSASHVNWGRTRASLAGTPTGTRLSVTRLTLALPIVLSGLVDLPRALSLGPGSSLAALTVIYALLAWLMWLTWPVLTRVSLGVVVPLASFLGWGFLSFLWNTPTIQGVQNLLVWSAFLGFILLASSRSQIDRKIGGFVGLALRRATWIAVGLYMISILWSGLGNEAVLGPRSFALFALLGLASYLSRWRYGERRALWWSGIIVLAIGASLSRLALIVALVLFPLSQISLTSRRGLLRAVLSIVLIAGVSGLALTYVEPLQSRFTEGDRSLRVHGVTINTEGRTELWEGTLNSSKQALWMGQGAGSSEVLVNRLFFPESQPHNDYLRLLHDYGMVGLGLWVLAFLNLLRATFRAWTRADRANTPEAPVYLAAFLSVVAVSLSMITDNVMVYIFVMAPLGILAGAALVSVEGDKT